MILTSIRYLLQLISICANLQVHSIPLKRWIQKMVKAITTEIT